MRLTDSNYASFKVKRTKMVFITGGGRGDLDPVSRTNFREIHAERYQRGNFKSLFFSTRFREILGFYRMKETIHGSRIFQEANYAFINLQITLAFLQIHASHIKFGPNHASHINPLPSSL